MNAILDDLTPAQREAAIQSGPVLVIAGAVDLGGLVVAGACGSWRSGLRLG